MARLSECLPTPPLSTPPVPSRQALLPFPSRATSSKPAHKLADPASSDPNSSSPLGSPPSLPTSRKKVSAEFGSVVPPSFERSLRAALAGNRARKENISRRASAPVKLTPSSLSLEHPSSSSSSRSPGSSDCTPSSAVKRVMFDPQPLASVGSTPRHAHFHPYNRQRPQLYSATRVKAELLGPISPPASSSPVAASRDARRQRETSSGSDGTDSDAESEAVSSLLMAKSQLLAAASSTPPRGGLSSDLPSSSSPEPLLPPLAPFSLSIPQGPRSILKPSNYPVFVAASAFEGSKKNGRTKHQLSFDEFTKDLVIASTSTAAAAGSARPANSTQNARQSASNSAGGKDKGKGKEVPAAGGVFGGEGPSANEQPPPTPAELSYEIDDEHPLALLSPLLILRASLDVRPAFDNNEPASLGSAFPRQLAQPSTSHSLPSPALSDSAFGPTSIGITLSEVEMAYVSLTRALVRLPVELKSKENTLAPLKDQASILRRCFERELTNLSTGAGAVSSAAPASAQKKGLTDDETRRQRDECAAAQTALKCFAALARHNLAAAVFTPAEYDALLAFVVSLPTSDALPRIARKEVLPFVSFFFSTQRLPVSLLTPHMAQIAAGLEATLRVYDDKQRHDRINMAESLVAIAHVLKTHPAQMLASWQGWFPLVMDGLWDGPKKGISVRGRALNTLAAVASALSATDKSEDTNRDIAQKVADIFSTVVAHDKLTSSANPGSPIARDKTDPATRLTQLVEQLVPLVPAGGEDPRAKTDDGPWLVIVTLLAVIPVLMEQRFRRLQPRGIRPWITLFNLSLNRPIPHVRNLAALAWTHLVYGFLRVRPDVGAAGVRKADDPSTVGWIFREDGKPFGLLNQVFSNEAKATWRAPQGQLTPTHKSRSKAFALPLAHTLVATLYGVSVLVHNGPDSIPTTVMAPSDAQLNALSHVWQKLVVAHLLPALRAAYDDVRGLAWSALAALVRTPTEQDRTRRLGRLVNSVFLDGSVPATRTPKAQAALAAKALGAAVSADEIPAWASEWTVARINWILKLIGDATEGMGPILMTTPMVEDNIVPVWTNLMATVAGASDSAERRQAVELITEWLTARMDTSSSGSYYLGATLAPITVRALGAGPAAELCTSLFESDFAFTESETWFTRLAINFIEAAKHTEAAWPVADLVLCAFHDKVSSSKRYVALRAKFGEIWAHALSSKDANEQFNAERFGSLVRLLNVYLRSTEAANLTEPWAALATSLTATTFTNSAEAAARRDTLGLLLRPPSAPAADVRLMSYFLAGAAGANLQENAKKELLEFARGALGLLFVALSGDWIEVVTNMLVAAGELEFPLYATVLGFLEKIAEPTSVELHRLKGLLNPTFVKAFAVLEAHEEPGRERDAAMLALSAMRDLWAKTFDQATERLEIPEEMVDYLVALRRQSKGLIIKDLADTQPLSIQDNQTQMHLDQPQPAQPLRTQKTIATSTSGGPRTSARSKGYEADASRPLPKFPAVPSSSTDPTNTSARTSLPEPSVSLAMPALTEVVHESAPSTVLDETPREVDRERSRSSLAALGTTEEEDRIAQQEEEEEEAMSLPPKPKRKRHSRGAATESTASANSNAHAAKKAEKQKRKAEKEQAKEKEKEKEVEQEEEEQASKKRKVTRSTSAATLSSSAKSVPYVEIPLNRRALLARSASAASSVFSADKKRDKAEEKDKTKERSKKRNASPEEEDQPASSPSPVKKRKHAPVQLVPSSPASSATTVPSSPVPPTPAPKVKPAKRKSSAERRVSRRQRQLSAELSARGSQSPPAIHARATPSTPSQASTPLPGAGAPAPPLSPTSAAREAEETVRRFLALSADAAAKALQAVGGSPGLQRLLNVSKRASEWFGASSSPSRGGATPSGSSEAGGEVEVVEETQEAEKKVKRGRGRPRKSKA